MNNYAVYKADNYDDIYPIIEKHFEAHNIRSELSDKTKVLIKPNLVTDKEAVFSVTTNPYFLLAIIKYLKNIGVKNIVVADCPGGGLLFFSKMQDVYKKCGYDILAEFAELNVDFESVDVQCSPNFENKQFNILKVIADADYIINAPKLKTHNATCITAAVKNIFGCIPGLQKPEFHAKYPKTDDFCNMLVELAATVKPNFTIVDAVDIMEGNGPTNGKKRFLGLTFSSKDVFGLDKFIAEFLDIPSDLIGTIRASEKKNFIADKFDTTGDLDFKIINPLVLPELVCAESFDKKVFARIKTLFSKIDDAVFISHPSMNKACVLCRKCIVSCPQKALSIIDRKIILNKKLCIGCMCCDEVCPNGAVDLKKSIRCLVKRGDI